MKTKKIIITYFELILIISSTFAFSYILYSSRNLFNEDYFGINPKKNNLIEKALIGIYKKIRTPLFQVVSAQQIGCCSINKNSEKCATSTEEYCAGQFAEGALCSSTSFCVKGCCYNEKKGIYDNNVLRADCTASWNSDPNCNLPGAKKGCCVLGSISLFVTQGQCQTESSWRGLELEWKSDLNELQCILLSSTQKEGACVLGGGECKLITEKSCLNYKGEFNEGYLCTSKELNTSCEKTTQTACIDGKDGVYFLDSCGNIANIYDSSKMNDQNYWEKIAPLEESCGASNKDGNANSKTCGNCNRFLGGICSSAGANNFNVNSGNFYCKPTSCMFKGEAYKNGESWCVYDGKIGGGDDIVGSRHWRYVCNNGEIQVEPCADYRNQICIQSNTFDIEGKEIEFRTSSCVANNWRECISLNSEEDGLEKCAKTLNCRIEKVNIADKFSFDVCTPKYPAGFDLTDQRYSETAKAICGMATQKCTVVYKPKLFGGCEIEYNGDCLTEEFTQKMNDFCRSLGDCGGEVNIVGKYTENYKVTKAPRLSSSWINKLKQLANPIPGQRAEVEDYTKYLKSAGVISGGENGEDYDITSDFMKTGAGFLGIGYAAGVYATGSLTLAELSGIAAPLVDPVGAGFTANMAGFAGAAIGAGIGMLTGAYLAKALGLAPIGSILMAVGGSMVGSAMTQVLGIIELGALFAPLMIIGIILTIISLFFGGSDCDPKTVTFECKPWQPPTGGSDCEKCNGDPLKPCSEYRCQNLGAACELVNKGTNNELCVHKNPNDVIPPKLQPQYGVISENKKYSSISDKGFKISSTQGECLDAYTDILFGITTDEPAQCRFDLEMKDFSEMNFDFGSNLFGYNHTMFFTLPDPSHGESHGVDWSGELTLYVKCQDTNGHETQNFYTIDMCVNQGPDKTAPRIRAIEPEDNRLISFNSTEEKIKVITNELSTCKWDTSDKDYSMMNNKMICEDGFESPSSTQGYSCETTLSITSIENKYYIRCKDQPWLEELNRSNERNANTQSTLYTLRKPESKITIDWIAPNEDFRTSTEFTTIEIQVRTSGGGEYHICSYSMSGYEKMIEIFETGEARIHKQPGLSVPSKQNIIYIECKDETGDFVRGKAEFEILLDSSYETENYEEEEEEEEESEIDSSSPQIARVWQEKGKIYFITNEPAECSYSKTNCEFKWNNETSTSLGEKHTIEIFRGQIYYIKCKDEFENLPAGCSITISPT